MRRSMVSLLLLVIPVATGTAQAVRGREVSYATAPRAGQSGRLRGELLAVDQDSVWVLGKQGVVAVRLGDLTEGWVRRHGLKRSTGILFGSLVGLASGVALMAACSSVEGAESCGALVPAFTLTGGVLGVLAGVSMESSSHLQLPATASALRPYARFPQGMPDGISREQLANTRP